MDNKIIKTLKEKGVDPAIILDLILEDETPAAPEAQAESEATAATEATAEPAAQAAPEKDAILAAIEKLTGAIQASNIMHSGTSSVPEMTSADALAQLINPKGGK